MISTNPSSTGLVRPTHSAAGHSFPAFRLLFCLLGSLVAGAATRVAAAPPAGAQADPLYDKGYIVATYYSGVYNNAPSDPAKIASTTTGLQNAINDARETNKVLYLPAGTYIINNTLKAWVQTREKPGWINNNIVIIGSTKGTRPIIRLAANASGFDDTANPKVMLEFRNFDAEDNNGNPIPLPATYNPALEKPNAGYGQMLRNVTLDCNAGGGNGNAGAVGLYFNHAQDSSIENVKVDATDALCGIWGIPARAWGAVNIEVVGGKYGIDTTPWSGVTSAANIGSVIAGLKLAGQTESAIRHPGQALTIVGFEIDPLANATKPAVTIGGGDVNDSAQAACLNLIDGKITLASGFSGSAAVLNPYDRSIYLRNVSITGSSNLVKTGSRNTITGTGTWKRIDEYSFCNQGAAGTVGRETFDIINGNVTRTPGSSLNELSNGEVVAVTSSAPTPLADLIGRHVWASLPTVDDTDYYDPSGIISPGSVSHTAFQDIINANRKIFLRPGAYRLTGPITLKSDTILFGAARHLTSIEVDTAVWKPTAEAAIVTTDNDATATTYLGDLNIAMPADSFANDYFTALDWRSGANSMVHIGRPFHNPRRQSEYPTQPHSMIKIRSAGGGRMYFLGRGEAHFMEHNAFRILKVENTSSPMWIYGLNLEHARSDKFAEFVNVSNARIYCVKTEFSGETGGTIFKNSTLLSFTNAQNVALFGHSALRHAPATNFNILEVLGTSNKMLASLIVPQENNAGGGKLFYENINGLSPISHDYPKGIALYKRGSIAASDETIMKHAHIGYAPLPAEWTKDDIGSPGLPGSAYYGSGTYTLNGSGTDVWGASDEFHFVYQSVNGDRTITARVATQENTAATAKAGVMFRAGTGATARFVNMHVRPNGTALHYRTLAGGTVTSKAGPARAAPYYVRLKRVGDTFTASASANNIDWTEVGSVTISGMPDDMLVGLFNCSVNDTALNTATFDTVSFSP